MEQRNTEERIFEATLNVIIKKTLSGASLQNIADEAGLVKSNIHYYFKTKDELFAAFLHYLFKRLNRERDDFLGKRENTFSEQIQGLFDQKLDVIFNHKEFDFAEYDFRGLCLHNEKIREIYIWDYNTWREGVIKVLEAFYPEMEIEKKELAAYMIVSMMMGASWQYLMDEKAFDLKAYFSLCKEAIVKVCDD